MVDVALELVLEGRGFPQWTGGLLAQGNSTEIWKCGVFKDSRAGWSGWSLEFKIDRLESRMELDYGEHSKPC